MKKLLLALITLSLGLTVQAQSLEIVAPVTPGGPVDIFARHFQKYLQSNDIQSVVVNKPGADGRIAMRYVMSKPEGSNTIFVATTGPFLFNKILLENSEHEFTQNNSVLPVARTPLVVAVSNDSGIQSWQDFLIKAKSNKINCGISNSASGFVARYIVHYFNLTGTQIVPFKGSSDVSANLIGNNINCAVDTLVTLAAAHKSNRIKIVAMGSSGKFNDLNLPVLADSIKGFEFYNWFGFAVLKNHKVDQKVLDLARTAFTDETFSAGLRSIEFEVIKPPTDSLSFLNSELNRFEAIRRQLGLEKAAF